MDTQYYSTGTVDKFIRKSLCNNDKLLYKYYLNDDVKRFRSRLIKVGDPKGIELVIFTLITDSIRDIILLTISSLTEYMKPFGDMIITGGEAFNTFFERKDKIVTSDIDTKFTPVFRIGKSERLKVNDPRYFGYLQATKLILWDKLGQMMKHLNDIIDKRMRLLVKSNKIAKILGLKLPSGDIPNITRRYTLLHKRKQGNNSKVVPDDVLIDVELFAIDMKVRYFSIKTQKLSTVNLGGILDIAFMRPKEIGYEVAYSRIEGKWVQDYTKNGKWVYDKNLLYASEQFLIEDLYTMQSLGLRPDKKEKDKKRMYVFAKKVLKLKNIKPTDTTFSIFKKSIAKIKPEKIKLIKRPYCPKCIISAGLRINPNKYARYTTEPITSKAIRLSYGLTGPKNLTINRFAATNGNYRFNTKTRKWVKNDSTAYIKNETNYRPNKNNPPKMKLKRDVEPLYGLNPNRNSWIPKNLINKAARIPYVGLKNTAYKK